MTSLIRDMPYSYIKANENGNLPFQFDMPVIADPGGMSKGTVTCEYITYESVWNVDGTSGTYNETGDGLVGPALTDPTAASWTKVEQHAVGFPAGTWGIAVRLTWEGAGVNGGTVYFREPRLGVISGSDERGWFLR